MTQRQRLSPAEETLKIQPAALLLDLRIRELGEEIKRGRPMREKYADHPEIGPMIAGWDERAEAEIVQLKAARQDLQDVLDYLAPSAATVLGRLAWVESSRQRLQDLYALMGIRLDLTEIRPADWPKAVEEATK